MKKVNVIFGIIAMIFFSIGFSSCEKSEVAQSNNDNPVTFEKTIEVTDASGLYSVMILIESDSEYDLNEAAECKPYITVDDIVNFNDKNDDYNVHDPLELNSNIHHHLSYTVLSDDRILPEDKGYALHTNLKVCENKATCGIEGDPVVHATFKDELATKVYTSNNSHCGIRYDYYSKALIGWTNRGHWTLCDGASHTFDATVYTTRIGVKVEAQRYFDLNDVIWYVVP